MRLLLLLLMILGRFQARLSRTPAVHNYVNQSGLIYRRTNALQYKYQLSLIDPRDKIVL